jgi:DUF4097 and DUF4098 domain-containing protein YvlB
MKVLYGVVALLIAHGATGETIERTADAPAKGEVEIVNVSGEVHVIGWDRAQVQMTADVAPGVDEVDFERQGDRTLIRVKPASGNGGSSELRVHVPRDSTVSVKTVSASQTIDGVRGEQRLQSVSGGIRSQVWGEDFQAKSVSGGIVVTGNGRTSAHITSVSGGIELKDVGGELDLNSVSGAIEVLGGAFERARIKTTNGETRFQGALESGARFEAEAINGAINLQLRSKLDAEFDIETFNGSIDNCFGPKPQRTNQYAPGSALRFKEGNGSARVRLKTLNGAIELCHKP